MSAGYAVRRQPFSFPKNGTPSEEGLLSGVVMQGKWTKSESP